MDHVIVYISDGSLEGQIIKIVRGYKSVTQIFFLNENITVAIDPEASRLKFYGEGPDVILEADMPRMEEGEGGYSEVKCSVEENIIKLGFAECVCRENHPDLKGRSDRSAKVILGFRYVNYDYVNNCVVQKLRK
jgi:hypothetical protein